MKKVDEEDFDLDGEEILPMWLQLKRIIEPTIKNMTKRNASLRSTSKTNESNNTIEQPLSVDIINEIEEKNSENSVSKNQKQTTAEKEIIEKIQEKYNLNTEEARKFAKNSISITYRANGELNSAFDYQIELGIINININTSHIFYTSFLDKIYQLDESIKTTFELFLASFVKAIDLTSCINDEQRKANERLVTKWLSKITEYTHEQCED